MVYNYDNVNNATVDRGQQKSRKPVDNEMTPTH